MESMFTMLKFSQFPSVWNSLTLKKNLGAGIQETIVFFVGRDSIVKIALLGTQQ